MEKWKYPILGLLTITACAQIEHSGEVDVNVNLDFTELEKYFEPICRDELSSTASDEEVQNCVNEKIGQFMEFLSKIAPK